ncbi:probable amidase At4g34880 isoform X2 [Folsomia candida]|uniref:probable amidase At4g34880 isoform X2 n=1 Tax=Folsomia candida TaxID=158441 RepID=UPI001604BA1D|nr:probable amidase At4g34880 isoform X2 [Folsomia candida]
MSSKDLKDVVSKKLVELDELLSRCGSKEVDIREITITEAQKLFRSGSLTSSQLTQCYLKRIEMMDPHLKSVIEVNPDAVQIAEQADKDRFLGKPISLSPIHGIPILIKDNMGTFDRMETTAGAVAMERLRPKSDADVVKKLRAAGAVILGKTNPSEWAYFRSDDIPSGWSGRGGQTLSPYNLTSNPSGSSTGSAVAISSNLGLVALGTETDGSIIAPCSKGALVGLKPTIGTVSTRGVIPLAFSQDVVGPMTRSVSDAVILMKAIMNLDFQPDVHPNIIKGVDRRKFNVGVVRNFWDKKDETIAPMIPQLESSLAKLSESGMLSIVDNIQANPKILADITADNEMIVLRHEFKYSLNKYIRRDVVHLENELQRKISSLADIIKFNIEHPTPEGYNQTHLIGAEATDGLQNTTYQNARDTNRKLSRKLLSEVMDMNRVDAIAAPCASKDSRELYSIGAAAGYPSITVPVGVDESHMPFGICFLGRQNSDFLLLEIARVMEAVLSGTNEGRVTPQFKW